MLLVSHGAVSLSGQSSSCPSLEMSELGTAGSHPLMDLGSVPLLEGLWDNAAFVVSHQEIQLAIPFCLQVWLHD